MLSLLEKRHCPYVFRFTRYKPLELKAQPYLARYQQDLREHPEEVRQEEFRCYEMHYKADEWEQSRRVVLVVVPPQEDELFARFFFLAVGTVCTYSPLKRSLASLRRRITASRGGSAGISASHPWPIRSRRPAFSNALRTS